MADRNRFRRTHRTSRGHAGRYHRRSVRKDDGIAYPSFVAACAALAVFAVLNPDRMPAPVQGLVAASRNMGRDNAPTIGAYYHNCASARAAGVAPLYAGEPGYRIELDGDSDGVACEPYRGM